MKKSIVYIYICIIAIVIGCTESTTDVKDDMTPRLILTADKTSGQSPLTVTYHGNFLGKIDTIEILIPNFFLYPSTGKTIIRYSLPDTSEPAKRVYTDTATYSGVGVVKAVMVLQGKNKDYISDTLTITIY